jgi:hypothetical protein
MISDSLFSETDGPALRGTKARPARTLLISTLRCVRYLPLFIQIILFLFAEVEFKVPGEDPNSWRLRVVAAPIPPLPGHDEKRDQEMNGAQDRRVNGKK